MSEHLPKVAQLMHRATVVRSMHHSVNNSHGAAVFGALTRTGSRRTRWTGVTRPIIPAWEPF